MKISGRSGATSGDHTHRGVVVRSWRIRRRCARGGNGPVEEVEAPEVGVPNVGCGAGRRFGSRPGCSSAGRPVRPGAWRRSTNLGWEVPGFSWNTVYSSGRIADDARGSIIPMSLRASASECTKWLRHSARSLAGGEFTLQPIGERHNIADQDSEVITKTGLDRWRDFLVLHPLDRDCLVPSLKLLPKFLGCSC